MDLKNTTHLDDARLRAIVLRHTAPYRHDRLTVRFRYSRGADFSGTCFYRNNRIHVNLGRNLRFPYTLVTHVAKAQSRGSAWTRPVYRLTVDDTYQLALFVYLHELFHYLVKAAGRSPRRKEAMCDRFATRRLVDAFGCRLCDASGRAVERRSWDFQDLDRLVARAPREPVEPTARTRPIPVLIHRSRPESCA